jgi:hypothetical protein
MARLPRRIVTTNAPSGRSRIETCDVPIRKGIVTELWFTCRSGLAPENTEDVSRRPVQLEPPEGGTVVRLFHVAPEQRMQGLSDDQLEEMYAAHFKEMGASQSRSDTTRHPGMHRTGTIDYVVLLSGSITLLLDDDQIDLEPFDIVVQRGTNHAWINHGDASALLMAVLVDNTEATQ